MSLSIKKKLHHSKPETKPASTLIEALDIPQTKNS